MEAPTLYPTLRYTDAPAAIDFLERAFGFRRLHVYREPGRHDRPRRAGVRPVHPDARIRPRRRAARTQGRHRAGCTSPSTMPTPRASARGPRAPRSWPSCTTPSTGRGTSRRGTRRATCGASGRTGRRADAVGGVGGGP